MAELTMTLFVVGLLFSLSVPAMARIGERLEREMFMRFLASELQYARMEALAREQEVRVLLEETSIRVIQGGSELRTVSVPPKYRLESNYPDGILFAKTGQARGGTVRLMLDGRVVGLLRIQVASGLPVAEWLP
ncbi:pilus assembly FimT family protein [Staphylospora marina]|uniref:pilus assembly FimT family protein n=1 Tax=Staphylospora marina TaxID=2490858 RepID=UPI0013DE6E8B|nr:GspH/FimT family pseudopilin [Staphylospora marina]